MTETTKHTPGPWHVLADPVWKDKHPLNEARFIATSTDVDVGYENGEKTGWRFENNDSAIICTMPDAQNQKANAQLIAAAPELLAELQWIKCAMLEIASDGQPMTVAQAEQILSHASRGISKATQSTTGA